MVLALTLCLGALSSASAQDPPPAPPAPATTPKATPEAAKGGDEAHHQQRLDRELVEEFGLTPAIVEKLSPDQIHQILLKGKREERKRPEDVLVPIGFFLVVFAIVAAILYQRHRSERERHATLREMIEKGTAIPPELITPPTKRDEHSNLRRGVVLTSLGVGMVLCLLSLGKDKWGLGLLPGFIGLGYLLVWRLERSGHGN
jgi:hypothetical protein